jgi:cell division protein FtsW (lipid II flippase)
MKPTRSAFTELHWPLLAVVACIAALGCYNLHSAAAGHDPRLYLTQMGWFGLGSVLCALVLLVDYRVTETVAYLLYAVACALLVAVLLSGKQAMGARRWLVVGPLTFQPSEIAKVATILCMARYFSHRGEPGGYSLGGLLRPLNPTRPLAALAWVGVHWNKPWLSDPLGELARGIHTKLLGAAQPLEDLLWFRLVLLGWATAWCMAAWLWVGRAERAASLLDPWPKARRRRLNVALLLGYLTALTALLAAWNAPVLADPFGALINYFNAQAQAGGAYAEVHPGLSLRATLLGATLLYLLASLLHMRHAEGSLIDTVVAPFDLLAVPALMTLVQPDLGTAMIIILIGMTIILIVGVRLRSLFILGLGAAFTCGVAWFGVLKDYQKRRILTFIDPEQDIRGAGWNAVQSLIAVGSGRWFGKGHMGGTQTQLSFLPEQHTDFAFSVWAEEQGFVGCMVLLLLYLLLLTLALAVAAEARDTYGALLATGVAALILWQAVINIGMVIGVLPVVGLTLPLFSYGGSSVLTVMLGIGILLNIHWRRRAH